MDAKENQGCRGKPAGLEDAVVSVLSFRPNLLRTFLLACLLQTSVWGQELVLPSSLEGRRSEFIEVIRKSQGRIERFCEAHDWSFLLVQPILGKVEVFDSKTAFDDHLRQLYPEVTKGPIPRAFAAGFEGDTFFAVAPEIYAQNVPQFVEPDFYEKLIAHEMAHKLHTRLLHGHEEKMGPIWFWEGFATFVSGQFQNGLVSSLPSNFGRC